MFVTFLQLGEYSHCQQLLLARRKNGISCDVTNRMSDVITRMTISRNTVTYINLTYLHYAKSNIRCLNDMQLAVCNLQLSHHFR